jgi:predicted phage terminase large subunit-like protein
MGDLYGELMTNDSFDKLHRPAINKKGELYFPERLSKEFLASQRKEQGAYIYNSQYMLQPLNDEASVFHPDIIGKYERLPNITDYYIIFDPAISENSRNDPSTVVVVGRDHRSDIYVVEYKRLFEPPNVVIDQLFNLIYKYKTKLRKVGLETVSGYKLFMFMLKDEMKRRNMYVRLQELKTMQVKKEVRIETQLQPLFANGMLLIGVDMPELEQELFEFPFGEYDDLLDCLAYITQILKPTGGFTQKNYTNSSYVPTVKVTGY